MRERDPGVKFPSMVAQMATIGTVPPDFYSEDGNTDDESRIKKRYKNRPKMLARRLKKFKRNG